jgi:MerR family transcriptional regulator, copper efflux regulator
VLIGEAARRAGVSKDTVRLYTRLGLVNCTTRTAGSREYADYDDAAVELIGDIKIAQSIGFTLAELRPIADEYLAGTLDPGKQRALLCGKLDEIAEKRRRLDATAEFLRRKLDQLPG